MADSNPQGPETVVINAEYSAAVSATVELPAGRAWDDVERSYIKWDTLHLIFKDGTVHEEELLSDANESIDWKRPLNVEVYATDDALDPDWGEQLEFTT